MDLLLFFHAIPCRVRTPTDYYGFTLLGTWADTNLGTPTCLHAYLSTCFATLLPRYTSLGGVHDTLVTAGTVYQVRKTQITLDRGPWAVDRGRPGDLPMFVTDWIALTV